MGTSRGLARRGAAFTLGLALGTGALVAGRLPTAPPGLDLRVRVDSTGAVGAAPAGVLVDARSLTAASDPASAEARTRLRNLTGTDLAVVLRSTGEPEPSWAPLSAVVLLDGQEVYRGPAAGLRAGTRATTIGPGRSAALVVTPRLATSGGRTTAGVLDLDLVVSATTPEGVDVS